MARQRLYYRWDIPTTVVEIVRTVCADYDRRERMIKHATITGDVLARCVELNSVVDNALSLVEVGIRREMLRDVFLRRGYDSSPCSLYVSKNAYYQRKRKLIHDIAGGLALIPAK